MAEDTQSFYTLTPDKVLDAIEEVGVRCTGRALALNSMENRVYEVEIEIDEQQVRTPADRFRVAKFYRPGRWTKEQIQEEHDFLFELQAQDIPVVAPLRFPDKTSLKTYQEGEIYYTVFPKVQGRNLDELRSDQLEQMGRLIARMHQVGSSKKTNHRLQLTTELYGRESLRYLKTAEYIPQVMQESFFTVAESLCELCEDRLRNVEMQRIHGDCHVGNVLWKDSYCFVVDFDDFLTGPAVQDIWLLTPGRDEESLKAREVLLQGYEQLRHFDRSTLQLIEPLRTLRIIYFCGWIARRYEDPSFQRTFPDFCTEQYWRDIIITLQEQERIIQYGQQEF